MSIHLQSVHSVCADHATRSVPVGVSVVRRSNSANPPVLDGGTDLTGVSSLNVVRQFLHLQKCMGICKGYDYMGLESGMKVRVTFSFVCERISETCVCCCSSGNSSNLPLLRMCLCDCEILWVLCERIFDLMSHA